MSKRISFPLICRWLTSTSAGSIPAGRVRKLGSPHEEPSHRGNNGIRLKGEWDDGMAQSYLFEKKILVAEASSGQPYSLKPERVLRNVKFSFQEIFELGDGNDEELIPILSILTMLANAPSATCEGLTLYGKDGEVKGTITRKRTVSTMEYSVSFTGFRGLSRGYFNFYDALEYKDQKGGKRG